MKKNYTQKLQKILDYKILSWKDGKYLKVEGVLIIILLWFLTIGFFIVLCHFTDCEGKSNSFRGKFEKHQNEVEQRAIQNQAENIARDYVRNIGK